jgi:hypothetical protein
MVNQYIPDPKLFRLIREHDQLGIEKIDFITDPHKNLLILLIKGNEMVYNEIYAFVKGSKLFLESSVPLYNNCTPVRIHLLGRETVDEVLEGDRYIGFSEINLRHNFHFKVLSYQVIKPGLFKIVLSYSKLNKNTHLNNIN